MLKQVRGTRDLIGGELNKVTQIYRKVYRVANNYGFSQIETPVIEYADVFVKNLGNDSDVVMKEMYTFIDKSNNTLALRPEFTAPVCRAFITNNLQQRASPLKLICHGPLFRYERPQKGRQRQFHQVNCEIIGEESYLADVEAISLAVNMLKALNIERKVQLELNSLGDEQSYNSYRKALVDYLESHRGDLSSLSQERLVTNPLRILDTKEEGDRRILAGAPIIQDYYNEESEEFFSQVKLGLDAMGIVYKINPLLVRGLDYYSHTTFEFTTNELGAQNAVIAGGRYDRLIQQMGGGKIPAVGFAGGVERISELMDDVDVVSTVVALIPIGEAALMVGLKVAHQLRADGIVVNLFGKGNVKKRFKKAEGSVAAVIIGEQEIESNQLTVKDMSSGSEIKVGYDELLPELKKYYTNSVK